MNMRVLCFVCAAALFLGLASLPIGYYTFLRIFVTIGAVSVIVTEYRSGFSFWLVSFAIIGVLFNPLMPIYLHDKNYWIPLDIISGILFLVKAYNLKHNVK